MMRRFLAVAFLAPTLTHSQQIVGRSGETFNLSEKVTSGAWVRIASPNGSVSISQGTGTQVEVTAEKILRSGSAEDIGFVVYHENGGLTVCAVFENDDCEADGSLHHNWRRSWRGDRQPRVNFTVRIPAGVKVRGSTGNGDVSVTGAGDEAIAASGNGKVLVSNTSGRVKASTGNGLVTVEGAKGPVEASTGNGDVHVNTSVGPVNASSGNGDIIATMDQIAGREDMEFSTGNGRITITVPDNFGAELESETGNGSIESDFPITIRGRLSKSHVRGTLGSGGARLTLSSGNGRIEIRKRA